MTKMLLLTAAMWCTMDTALSQHQMELNFPTPQNPYLVEVPSKADFGNAQDEYEIEMARLPKLLVSADSEEGFKLITRQYPNARQINILDTEGHPIYRYLPTPDEELLEIPKWPKGVYLIELYFETERKISSERLVIL